LLESIEFCNLPDHPRGSIETLESESESEQFRSR
jgi:hypothetical protein